MAKKIEELTKQLSAAKVDSKDKCAGVWTSKDKNTVRKVYEGPKGRKYYVTASGTKVTVTKGDWEAMDESEADKRIAAHEAWKLSSPTK